MERLLIALVVVVISSIFNNKGKANKKRKTNHLPPKKKTEFNPHQSQHQHEPQYNTVDTVKEPKHTITKPMDENYINAKILSYENQDNKNEYEVLDSESGEMFNFELSDLQRAIVMKEVLSKPVALRKSNN